MKNVISFSLYGSDPKYNIGAVRNLELQPIYYPGWICRFYVDDTVPIGTVQTLECGGAECIRMPRGDGNEGLFWRFEAAFDTDIDRFVVRDCDSRLNIREAHAVQEWISSGCYFHCMRDHPGHDIPIIGCGWGARREHYLNRIFDHERKFRAFIADMKKPDTPVLKRSKYFYFDQIWLMLHVWPAVQDVTLVHFSNRISDKFGHGQFERPFRVTLPEGQFVGQQWGADDKPLEVPL